MLRVRAGRTTVVAGAAILVAAALAATGVGDADAALPNWQALILGLVQGATELLPISSSGHLILVPWLGEWRFLEQNDAFNQTFDVALHLGTTLAVAGYFARDLVRLARGWGRTLQTRTITTPDERLAWLVVVATSPAAAIGLVFGGPIVSHLGEPWQIAILLAVFAVVLWLADRAPARRPAHTLRLWEGLGVGVAQALALMPGVSRSGITISAARFLGLDRDAAARFSFLLLIPTTTGAVLLEGVTNVLLGDLPTGWRGPFVVGVLAAWGSGLLAIHGLLTFVRRHTFNVFVVYRLLAAAAIALLIVSGARAGTF